MSVPSPSSPGCFRHTHVVLAALLAVHCATASLRASIIQTGNVTTTLGPTFFIDDAANGGSDTDYWAGGYFTNTRSFRGLLTNNQGPTQVALTGFGFAAHTSATNNNATNVNVSFTYLGADSAYGGGDDVFIGTASGTYSFTAGGEYVFAFSNALTATLPITGTTFGIVIHPVDGKMKLKTGTISYHTNTNTGPRLSVAGVTGAAITPNRVNLAKFQAATASDTAGQRLASYLTDGVAGNDNRWQGNNNAWNWIRIDFPFPVEVGSAHVYTGVDGSFPIGSYGLQALSGTNWVNIPGGSVTSNTNAERNLVFSNPVTASAFRFMSSESSLRVREIALYPTNGPAGFPLGTDVTINLAYQRPAFASTNSPGNFPLHAVDGRANAFMWQTTTAGTNTLDVDLRVASRIGSVHLYSGSTGVAPLGNFVLKSWDSTNSTWVNIPGGTVTGNTLADRVVTFSTPVTTSQVRLEFNNPGTTSVRELCVFPANAGNAGYPLGTNLRDAGKLPNVEDFNDSYHQVRNPDSGRHIAVATGGAPALDQAGITTAQGQYQVLLNVSNGTYRLRNRDTGNCLSGAQLSKTVGQPLTDTPYTAMPHQDWVISPLGNGTFRIINAWSGLAIDTQGGATGQGTVLVQNTVSDTATQRWQFANTVGHPKKGIGGTAFTTVFNANWTYGWGRSNTFSVVPGTVFHPMQWGNFSWDINVGSGPLYQNYPNWRDTAESLHLLGFNEPDRFDQSGRSLDPANPQTEQEFDANRSLTNSLRLWPRMLELDLPLVGPAPASPDWLNAFFTEANRLGYRVDYTAIHLYPGPSSGSSDGLISSVLAASTNGGSRPVWLTEFSFVDWEKNQSWSEEDNYNALAEFIWRAESVPELRKYALFVFTADDEYPQPANPWQDFTPAPRSNSREVNGNLTAFGKLYAAWDNDANVRTNKTYYIHNQGTRKRIANLTSQSNLAGRNIRTDGDLVHWTLVPVGPANRYYVVSSLDGRRLSTTATSAAAGTVSLVAPGTTGTAVEWSLTEAQHGWFYLGHPHSTRRLQLVYNDSNFVATYSMAAGSTTTDAVRWRFIVPPSSVTGNTAPSMPAIAPRSVNEGSLLSFGANGADADIPAVSLFYTLVNAPTGATIDTHTGAFSWRPTETQGPGIYNFTISASDGYLTVEQPVSVTVNEVNTPPALAAIPAQAVNEGSLLAFTASATDTDLPANTLTYSLLSAPSGAAINATTGAFTWTPSEAQGPGTFNFTVRVSDGTATHDQPVTVTVDEVNVAPALATIPAQSVNEGTLLAFTAIGSDADLPANTLAYSLLGAPAGAAINATNGNFTWTPTEAQGPGTFNFTARVSDGALTQDRSVSVTVNEVNTPPVLASIPPQTLDEGTPLAFTASATDADLPANTLAFSLVNAPAGAAINPATGSFSWTPSEAQGPGTFNFDILVSDGTHTHGRAVSVTVNEVTSPPVLAAIPAQTVDEDTLLAFTASATDADLPANTLIFSLVNAPDGATINPATGAFGWTPTETQGPGTFDFDVRVSDGTHIHDRAVSVIVNEVNSPPELAAIPNLTATAGQPIAFTASATDPDHPTNTPTYTLVNGPDGATMDSITGAFAWTPAEPQAPGTFNFSVQASDGSLTDEKPVTVSVQTAPPSSETDTDGDGLSDLLELAFLTSPTTPNSSPFRVVGANTNNTVTLEFPWNWQATNLSWQIRHGRDPSNVPAWPVLTPVPTSTVREGDVDRVTVTPGMIYPDCGFYILEVIQN